MEDQPRPCKLCQEPAQLQLSHILPAFAFRWLRESAGGGHLRNSITPNQRVQDGEKRYWLCNACELLFGKSEKLFADRVFYPYLENEAGAYHYGPWLLHFCASVSWRILVASLDDKHLHKWEPGALDAAYVAEQYWRDYLLGRLPHPGPYQQHLLPFSQIESTGEGFPPNINRYLMRAIQMDLCQGTKTTFTFAKLGRFAIFGFVRGPEPGQWRGTKVNANQGQISPRKYVLPVGLWNYLTEKSHAVRTALESVSDVQQRKIEEALQRKRETFVGSDAYAAMQADIESFGSAAFSAERLHEP